MKAHKYFISQFFCTECGNEGIPLPRPESKKRESGHLKILYCSSCRKETNFVEVREHSSYTSSDFIIEFMNNNFKDGKRIIPYTTLYRQLHIETVRKENNGESQNQIINNFLKRGKKNA